jgi:hypothetical protein
MEYLVLPPAYVTMTISAHLKKAASTSHSYLGSLAYSISHHGVGCIIRAIVSMRVQAITY